MLRYNRKFIVAARTWVLGVALVLAGTAGAQAGVIKVDFGFSAPAYAGDPYDISGSFTYDDALTGVIKGTQFLTESLTIQQGATSLPTVQDYLARFHWDADNLAIRAPNDNINTAITALAANSYFLDYGQAFGFSVYLYAGGTAFQESPGVPVARDALASGPPFSYTVTTLPTVSEPGTIALMALGLVALGLFGFRAHGGRRRTAGTASLMSMHEGLSR